MARTRPPKRSVQKKVPFPYRLSHPNTGQLALRLQSRSPALVSDRIISDEDIGQHEYEGAGGYEANFDHELVGPSRYGKRVFDEFKEDGADQETETEGNEEEGKGEDEIFEVVNAINGNSRHDQNQDPSRSYRSLEVEEDEGIDNSSDDHGGNDEFRTQPGTIRDSGDSEPETGRKMEENIGDMTYMDRLKAWLYRVRLDKYAPLFELHDVDDKVLVFLTVDDLKDMGVASVGSRWKINRYIQKLYM